MSVLQNIFDVEHCQFAVTVRPLRDSTEFRYEEFHVASNTVFDLLQADSTLNLVLDLEHIVVLSSRVRSTVLRWIHVVISNGGHVVLCNACPDVMQRFQQMKLGESCHYCDARNEALQLLQAIESVPLAAEN